MTELHQELTTEEGVQAPSIDRAPVSGRERMVASFARRGESHIVPKETVDALLIAVRNLGFDRVTIPSTNPRP